MDKICTDLNANSVADDDKGILFYVYMDISIVSLTKQVKCGPWHNLLVTGNATPSLTLPSDCPHVEKEVTAKKFLIL